MRFFNAPEGYSCEPFWHCTTVSGGNHLELKFDDCVQCSNKGVESLALLLVVDAEEWLSAERRGSAVCGILTLIACILILFCGTGVSSRVDRNGLSCTLKACSYVFPRRRLLAIGDLPQ